MTSCAAAAGDDVLEGDDSDGVFGNDELQW